MLQSMQANYPVPQQTDATLEQLLRKLAFGLASKLSINQDDLLVKMSKILNEDHVKTMKSGIHTDMGR